MNCNKKVTRFDALEMACESIVDFLFESENSANLWKLLYYTNSQPLLQPDLTNEQKRSLICKDLDQDNNSVDKGILFQLQLNEGFKSVRPQIRIMVDDINPFDAYRGSVYIVFQIIVPLNQNLIQSTFASITYRDAMIVKELSNIFDNQDIPNSGFSSPLYQNKQAQTGRGTKTGATKIIPNKNFTGYYDIFSVDLY